MSVPFDYYWNLRKDGRADFEKYRARNLPERFKNFKPDEILYEKHAKSVKSHPAAGRYDKFYEMGITGRKYKPGKLLTEAPDCTSYAYYYRNDIPVFVREWDDPQFRELQIEKSPKLLSYKPNWRFCYTSTVYISGNDYVCFDLGVIPLITVFCVEEHEEYNRYFSIESRMGETYKPIYPSNYEEKIVSKDKKKLDVYKFDAGSYSATHYKYDGPCDDRHSNCLEYQEDSKFIDISGNPFRINKGNSLRFAFSIFSLEEADRLGYKPIDTSEYRQKEKK